MAIVDEDQGLLGGLITSAAANEQARESLEIVVLDRAAAMSRINDNEISAVLVLPKDFSRTYLAGQSAPSIELIKNPAQSFMPTISEELVRVLVELLNAVSLNLAAELPEVSAMFEGSGLSSVQRFANVAERLGDRLERSEAYLFPPIIGMEEYDATSTEPEQAGTGGGFNVIAFVMPGLIAMFLLFSAEAAAKDLIVERRSRTLTRYQTLAPSLFPLYVAKSMYALIVTLLAAAIMLVGGSWLFGITWDSPWKISLLTIGYAVFCVGFAFTLIAVIFRERLIAILTTMVIMFIGFFGGSMLPADDLPLLIRNHISPWMPNYVFAQSIKQLQFDSPGPEWSTAATVLAMTGIVLLAASMLLFQSRLRRAVEG